MWWQCSPTECEQQVPSSHSCRIPLSSLHLSTCRSHRQSASSRLSVRLLAASLQHYRLWHGEIQAALPTARTLHAYRAIRTTCIGFFCWRGQMCSASAGPLSLAYDAVRVTCWCLVRVGKQHWIGIEAAGLATVCMNESSSPEVGCWLVSSPNVTREPFRVLSSRIAPSRAGLESLPLLALSTDRRYVFTSWQGSGEW
jgi:hypothetical protein